MIHGDLISADPILQQGERIKEEITAARGRVEDMEEKNQLQEQEAKASQQEEEETRGNRKKQK